MNSRKSTNILGLMIRHCTYTTVLEDIEQLVEERRGLVAFCNVHMVTTAYREPTFRNKLSHFDIVAPDGQPIRWALNWFGQANLKDRVYGPELVLRLCERAATTGIRIFLYGSYEDRVVRLRKKLTQRFKGLQIVGSSPGPFGTPTPEDDRRDVTAINGSGADILLVGMGCPFQETWAYDHRNKINAVMLCVGGAFDFHSEVIAQAPRWMQDRGLEWIFRLSMEPGRLWRRYLINNPLYLFLLFLQWAGLKRFPIE